MIKPEVCQVGAEFFSFHRIPDLTLAQYSAEESGGIEDVIRQHTFFYRQLNRKGLLFGETFHLAYLYNPAQPAGNRLCVFFRVDSENTPVCMQEFMAASSLSTYYKFSKEVPQYNPVFSYRAIMAKQDGFVSSSNTDKNTNYYMVNPWKPNEKARLMGLFRIMQKLQRPVGYEITIRSADLSEELRDSFRSQIQFIRNAQKINAGNRDENAEQCLRTYDKFLESLRNNPHFLCRVCAFAENEALAKMILDAAASEAVEEGNYRIISEKGKFYPLMPSCDIEELCHDDAPRGTRRWNSIFLLKELVPFALFPVLYPGETIEMPKESAPTYERNGLYLGKDNSGYDVYFPLSLLPKHALLAGVPGSGKTFSMLHIASQLAGKETDIPILVLEPAKKEYRALAHNLSIPNLVVFSPGSTGAFPLRINPFEFPKGLKLSEHITSLNQVFEGAFDLTPPMPFLVSESIEQVYRDHGWYPFEVNDGSHTYPSIRELYNKIADLLDASDYASEIKSNLKSCLQVRIGSLITREMGNVFDVPGSTFSPEEWLCNTCVIELESLGGDASNFLTLLLLTLIRELLRQNPSAPKDKPRHVIFLEEAHNLIGPTTVSNAENGDAKVASTKYIVDMLAEVRALREAIIIADQLPTALASQITKNTSLKIGHRITAMDDRELLASTMSADGVQLERMGTFQPGHALCMYENIQKPFEIQISEYSGVAEPPDNHTLFALLADRKAYQMVMKRDADIMNEKFKVKKDFLIEKRKKVFRGKDIIEQNKETLSKRTPSKEEILKLEAQEIQFMRNLDKLVRDWTEFILEISDYCKMNILERQTEKGFLRNEMKDMIDLLYNAKEGYPHECEIIIDKAKERVGAGISWLSNKTT